MTVVKICLAVALVGFLGYQIYSLVVAIKKRKKEQAEKTKDSQAPEENYNDR